MGHYPLALGGTNWLDDEFDTEFSPSSQIIVTPYRRIFWWKGKVVVVISLFCIKYLLQSQKHHFL